MAYPSPRAMRSAGPQPRPTASQAFAAYQEQEQSSALRPQAARRAQGLAAGTSRPRPTLLGPSRAAAVARRVLQARRQAKTLTGKTLTGR